MSAASVTIEGGCRVTLFGASASDFRDECRDDAIIVLVL
jgi:hypothetical protein